MLLHASDAFKWLQNGTVKCKIALGTKQRLEKIGHSVCVWSNMFYSTMWLCAFEMWQVVFTNLCQFVKLDGSMSTCFLALLNALLLWAGVLIGIWSDWFTKKNCSCQKKMHISYGWSFGRIKISVFFCSVFHSFSLAVALVFFFEWVMLAQGKSTIRTHLETIEMFLKCSLKE